uniref:Ubiquitin-like protease family profile domain-containing protein n=1 Tax=Pyricularia oryzae (strain P131) TaxID=1143193 RepID=L7IQN3_PYRO1
MDAKDKANDAALASTLLTGAVERFQNLVSTWRNYTSEAPQFNLNELTPADQVTAFTKIAIQIGDTIPIRKLLRILAYLEASRQLQSQKCKKRKNIKAELLNAAYHRLESPKITYKTFKNNLSEASKFHQYLGALIVFLPFGEAKVTRLNSKGVKKHLEAHTQYQDLSQTGQEFLESIFTGDAFAKRIWEIHPFSQGLPLEHQVALLRIKSSDPLPGNYRVDQRGHVVLSSPLPKPSSFPTKVLNADCTEATSQPCLPFSPILFVSPFNLQDKDNAEAGGIEASPHPSLLAPSDFPPLPSSSSPWSLPATPALSNPLPLRSSSTLVVPTSWLTDNVIDEYMGDLAKKHGFCFFNSCFFNQERPINKKWKPEHGDPLTDLVMIPINHNHHWYLMVMYKPSNSLVDTDRTVCFLNSWESVASYAQNFERWLAYLNDLGWKGRVEETQIQVPQQTNGSDCGVYVLAFAKTIADNYSAFLSSPSNLLQDFWNFDAREFRKTIAAAAISGPVDNRVVASNREIDNHDDTVINSSENFRIADLSALPYPYQGGKRKSGSSAPAPNVSSSLSPADSLWDSSEGVVVERAQCAPLRVKRRKILLPTTRAYNDGVMTTDLVTVLRKGPATVGDEITMAETETAPLNVSLSLSPTELCSNPGASMQQNSNRIAPNEIDATSNTPRVENQRRGSSAFASLNASSLSSPAELSQDSLDEGAVMKAQPAPTKRPLSAEDQRADNDVAMTEGIYVNLHIRIAIYPNSFNRYGERESPNHTWNFPYELETVAGDEQAPYSMQTSDEACPGLVDAVDRLHTDGYLHWNDSFAAKALKTIQELDNFAQGLGILRSMLASTQLREFLRKWFAPSEGPYIIGHCFYYSDTGTGGLPIFLRRNIGQSDRFLGLHLLTANASVRYFVGSHGVDWAPTEETLLFKNDQSALKQYPSKRMSDGFALFDPSLNHQIEAGVALTIIVGLPQTFVGFPQLKLNNPYVRGIVEAMRKDIGIGWNLEMESDPKNTVECLRSDSS